MANPSADYPSSIHNKTDVSAFDNSKLGATEPNHTELEGKQEEEIAAVQAKVGTGSSTPTNNKVLKGTGAGTSAWGSVTTADLDSGVLDTDLSTVSGTDNTIPSAKATKAALDTKLENDGDEMTGQLLFDATNFSITNVPVKFSHPNMSDDDSSKGGYIEWGGIGAAATNYPYGIATEAYKNNPAATFTLPSAGYKKWAWIGAHYDSPAITGEDVHQHLNFETVQADWITAVTRLQISFGEDTALVSFPNSNVKFYPDHLVQIGSDANGLYIEHNTSANRIDMTSTTDMTFNQDLVIGANANAASRLDVRESTDRNMLKLATTLGSANGAAQLLIHGTTAGGVAIQSGLSSEGTNRWSMNTSGRMEWGSGSATRDTNLYRNAANELRTDDKFTASLGVNLGAAGVGIPSSATAAGTAGDVAWDSNFIYVCTATNTWKRTGLSTW